MARCCGQTGSCACRIDAGRNITVTGVGSSGDPMVIDADVALAVEDSTEFNLGLVGDGTLASPWIIRANYATGARLTSLPDVNAPSPTQNQVLAWDVATAKWRPVAPTTAATGSVSTDTSLSGDGSSGTPLQVREDPSRYLATLSAGLGLSDAGVNRTVRIFSTVTARNSASPLPEAGSLSTTLDRPGIYDYWNGSTWQPIANNTATVVGGQLMAISGSYTSGPVRHMTKQVNATTGADGSYDVLAAADLTGAAGVLSCQVTCVGAIPFVTAVTPVAGTPRIKGVAYNLGGTVRNSSAVTVTVQAVLY